MFPYQEKKNQTGLEPTNFTLCCHYFPYFLIIHELIDVESSVGAEKAAH
jgi:hypothetical protein